jgi:hypothetical protein
LTSGAEGSGGGGAGQNGGNGINGAANTGGGGGGCGGTQNYNGGSGGSGIVILKSLNPAIDTTGSPVSSKINGYYIYRFNASGSITF